MKYESKIYNCTVNCVFKNFKNPNSFNACITSSFDKHNGFRGWYFCCVNIVKIFYTGSNFIQYTYFNEIYLS